jgi:regulator of protease activity HflC (stomatin/prohibitin superfamily)
VQRLFVFAVILAAVTAGVFALAHFTRADRKEREANGSMTDDAFAAHLVRAVAWFLAGGLAVTVFFCSFNEIGTRDIGVVTSFGELAGHEGPGPDFTAPWDQVTSIDDSYQLTDEVITVRIAGGQTAQAPVQVRWNATEAAADDIFGNYKSTAGLGKGLLDPDLNSAVNTVLDSYNPIDAISSGAQAGTALNPSTAQLGARIKAVLEGEIGQDVNVQTFNLKPLVYDAAVQSQLNAASTQVGKTVVAQEAEKTADAQAAANRALQASLNGDPMVLVQQCMSGLASGQIQNEPGFSCWPGSGSGVVIPSTAAASSK